MKNKTVKEKWEEFGVNINLTKTGCNILAEMMADGCPRKFVGIESIPIECPLHSQFNPGNMCFICWKKFFTKFIVTEEKTNGTANG